jgi:hypothetical protein
MNIKGEGTMRRIACLLIASLAFVLSSGCASMEYVRLEKEPGSLNKEHFKETIVIEDDSLATLAKLSTREGRQEKRGINIGLTYDDNFLRAYVNKKTGETEYQVYNIFYYSDTSHWKFYYGVNYETPNGVSSQRITSVDTDVNCSGGSCVYNEDVLFVVDEDLIRWIAGNYTPGMKNAWNYKIIARSGEDYVDSLLAAEFAAIYEAVNEYKQSHGL